jgi:hypothetical protein
MPFERPSSATGRLEPSCRFHGIAVEPYLDAFLQKLNNTVFHCTERSEEQGFYSETPHSFDTVRTHSALKG